jgi:TonB family protein
LDVTNTVRNLVFLVSLTAAAQDASRTDPPVFHLGPDIATPFVISKAKPEFSAEAQMAKLEGGVLLSLVVDAAGQARDIHVDRPLGLGLDESAIENVRHWQFKPGTKAGMPVAVRVNEEVFFKTQRTLWDWHAVRVVFLTPEGATRPALLKSKFPATVDEEQNASVTIAFDVGPTGLPLNLRSVKSSDVKWESDILAAVRDGWRFHPGTIDGKPVTVPAWFELVRGSHSPIPPVPIPPLQKPAP